MLHNYLLHVHVNVNIIHHIIHTQIMHCTCPVVHIHTYMHTYIHIIYIHTYIHAYIHTYIHGTPSWAHSDLPSHLKKKNTAFLSSTGHSLQLHWATPFRGSLWSLQQGLSSPIQQGKWEKGHTPYGILSTNTILSANYSGAPKCGLPEMQIPSYSGHFVRSQCNRIMYQFTPETRTPL